MNPQIKADWLEALESGKYTHRTSCLQYQNRFCCLGVLCEVLQIPAKNTTSGVKTYNGQAYGLTEELMIRLNITPQQHEEITRINDEADNYRPAIQYIRENL